MGCTIWQRESKMEKDQRIGVLYSLVFHQEVTLEKKNHMIQFCDYFLQDQPDDFSKLMLND